MEITLVVLADTWKVHNLLDAALLEYLLGADARAFKDGRRSEGVGRYDDLLATSDLGL